MSNFSARPTRNQKACTSCRQVKLRCDSMQTFPAACSRCRKNNLECRIDPTFERTRTRQKLSEVTSQLKAIQDTLGNINTSGSNLLTKDKHLTPSSINNEDHSSPYNVSTSSLHAGGTENQPSDDAFYECDSVEDLPQGPVYLGRAQLESHQVRDLFKHFYAHKYRHCPILDTEKTVSQLFTSSPFLFWTIIVISCRLRPGYLDTYDSMCHSYQTLIGEVLSRSISSLETLHAIILICIWPLEVDRQSDDPTWNYCGLLYNAALKLGLHKSGVSSHGPVSPLSRKAERLRTKTWMACLLVTSRFVLYTGLSLPQELVKRSRSLEAPLSSFEGEFCTKYEIQRHSMKAAIMMSELDEYQDWYTFSQILCKDIEDVRNSHQSNWSNECEFQLLKAQLCIYGAQLQRKVRNDLSDPNSSRGSEDLSTKKMIIQLGFSTAIRLIYIFSRIAHEDSLSPSATSDNSPYELEPPQRFLPKDYLLSLMFATSFIFKAVAATSKGFLLDNDVARNHIHIVHNVFSTLTTRPMDEADRAVRLIEVLSRDQSLSQLHLSQPSAKDASNMSLLDEVIKTGQKIRTRKQEGNHGNTTSPTDGVKPSPTAGNLDYSDVVMHEPKEATYISDLDFSVDGVYNFDWDAPWELNFPASEVTDFGTGFLFGSGVT